MSNPSGTDLRKAVDEPERLYYDARKGNRIAKAERSAGKTSRFPERVGEITGFAGRNYAKVRLHTRVCLQPSALYLSVIPYHDLVSCQEPGVLPGFITSRSLNE